MRMCLNLQRAASPRPEPSRTMMGGVSVALVATSRGMVYDNSRCQGHATSVLQWLSGAHVALAKFAVTTILGLVVHIASRLGSKCLSSASSGRWPCAYAGKQGRKMATISSFFLEKSPNRLQILINRSPIPLPQALCKLLILCCLWKHFKSKDMAITHPLSLTSAESVDF